VFSRIISSDVVPPEIIDFFPPVFRPIEATKQFYRATKPFSVLAQMSGNSRQLSRGQRDGGRCRPRITGDSQMRTISFILAFAFILAGPSMAGSSDQHLPGVGTFAYNGSPVATTASQPIIVAAN
jgi:hypothetical protein